MSTTVLQEQSMARNGLSPLRRDRITASRLPAVLGISPYQTRHGLMREMVRGHFGDETEFAGSFITDYGNEHEHDAIAGYEFARGVQVHRIGAGQQTLVHPSIDFLAATPDGWTSDRVVECKAPWRARYVSITERPDYEAQMRLQMEVTGFDFADLVIWRPNQALIIETIERDRMFLTGERMDVLIAFMDDYRATIDDPEAAAPHREPLRDQRLDAQWCEASTDWKDLDFLIKQLKAEQEQAAERLKDLAPDKSAYGNGVLLSRYRRKGAVQHKKVYAAHGITDEELEKYRGKETDVVALRRSEGKDN